MKDSTRQTNRHSARHQKRTHSPMLTVTATVRSIALTAEDHVSCVLDSTAGRLRAFSDATAIHLPALRRGGRIRAALLRVRRVTQNNVYRWQLLGCQELFAGENALEFEENVGSQA